MSQCVKTYRNPAPSPQANFNGLDSLLRSRVLELEIECVILEKEGCITSPLF